MTIDDLILRLDMLRQLLPEGGQTKVCIAHKDEVLGAFHVLTEPDVVAVEFPDEPVCVAIGDIEDGDGDGEREDLPEPVSAREVA